MVFSIADKNPLQGLLTNVAAQHRNVSFNIQFNNLQNTIIDRMNSEVEDIIDAEGDQRKLDALDNSIKDLERRYDELVTYSYINDNNKETLNSMSAAGILAEAVFSVGDLNLSDLSADEVTSYEEQRDNLSALSNRLVDLSHPSIVDPNSATLLRSKIDELLSLSAVEGTIDDAGTSPATNDNRAIADLLDEISDIAGDASDVATTLKAVATSLTNKIASKIKETELEKTDITVTRAEEIEYEIQMLRTENANFLRSIELSYEASARQTDNLVEALNTQREAPLGSILSIFS